MIILKCVLMHLDMMICVCLYVCAWQDWCTTLIIDELNIHVLTIILTLAVYNFAKYSAQSYTSRTTANTHEITCFRRKKNPPCYQHTEIWSKWWTSCSWHFQLYFPELNTCDKMSCLRGNVTNYGYGMVIWYRQTRLTDPKQSGISSRYGI